MGSTRRCGRAFSRQRVRDRDPPAHLPYTSLLNADGTPKAAKEIWSLLAKASVPRYAEIVTVADDPGEAAANYYILKLMGFADVKAMMD